MDRVEVSLQCVLHMQDYLPPAPTARRSLQLARYPSYPKPQPPRLPHSPTKPRNQENKVGEVPRGTPPLC